jgi:RNA polymerase sigma-70 factor (ECF subfamily)
LTFDLATTVSGSEPAAALRVGPPPSFEELALPLFDSIYNSAHWLTRSKTDAEDLVQDAYLKAFQGFATFEPGTNFRAWILRILKNTFLSSRTSAQFRHMSAQVDFEKALRELPSYGADPVDILMEQARLHAIHSAMQRLPLSMRDVLVRCDLQGASYRETARELSIPIGTVMSRLARARKALRALVHDMHLSPAGAAWES